MSARESFRTYVTGPLHAGERTTKVGLEDIHRGITNDVQTRLQAVEYINTLPRLLRWGRERWPTYYKRRPGRDERFLTLGMCLRILWADYLAWAEA